VGEYIMDYNHITNFLDKFRKLIFQKEELNNLVVGVISKEINFQVENKKVKIKNGVIFVEGSPVLRSEIMIHKKQILDQLEKVLPQNKFQDIK